MAKVAIIGRQNVGKSTLFNALIGKRLSIEYDFAGVTRDLIEEPLNWGQSGELSITDFPGFEEKSQLEGDTLGALAVKRGLEQLTNFQLMLFAVSREGLTSYEHRLLIDLRKMNKPLWLLVNFVDDPKLENDCSDFYSLGIEKVFFVSGLNRRNINHLRNEIVHLFFPGVRSKLLETLAQETMQQVKAKKKKNKSEVEDKIEKEDPAIAEDNITKKNIKMAIIGKPNAGKSTYFNALLQNEIAITSPIAGTTRDVLQKILRFEGQEIEIVDTAGLRKKNRVHNDIEFFSVQRAKIALEQCDVALVLIDVNEMFDQQNKSILNLAKEYGKPVVLLFNKYDQVEDKEEFRKQFMKDVKNTQKQFWDFPYFFISALDKKVDPKALRKALDLVALVPQKIKTHRLNNLLQEIKRIAIVEKSSAKLKYITHKAPQLKLVVFVSQAGVPQHIQKFVSQKIQSELGLSELPLEINWRVQEISKKTD